MLSIWPGEPQRFFKARLDGDEPSGDSEWRTMSTAVGSGVSCPASHRLIGRARNLERQCPGGKLLTATDKKSNLLNNRAFMPMNGKMGRLGFSLAPNVRRIIDLI